MWAYKKTIYKYRERQGWMKIKFKTFLNQEESEDHNVKCHFLGRWRGDYEIYLIK